MAVLQPAKKRSWITLGGKLLLGVAVASNFFIGVLLAVNHRSTLDIEEMVGQVLAIRNSVDANLREMIVGLQNEFIALPRLFATDPKEAIFEQIRRKYQVEEIVQMEGRDAYASSFSRTARRDLANGQMVATLIDDGLVLAHGLRDAAGTFTDTVELLRLESVHPERDLAQVQALIAATAAGIDPAADLQEKIDALHTIVADKSIEAERTRVEILDYVNEIQEMERQMAAAGEQQRRFSFYAGGAAIVGNILVLFLLTRIIVEKPLHRLTVVVNALGAGRYPEVPWQHRRDQIGVLCAAINRFREALLELKREKERKAEEEKMIEHLVQGMTSSIHRLDERAGQLTGMSLSLQDLADTTERESKKVTDLADDTAVRTHEVATSSQLISRVVGDIHHQLASQAKGVAAIGKEIEQARIQLAQLKQSVSEIDGIVNMMDTVADQTKILAINAAIEAVKAGEHGRGFAVVAEEVKKLSLDTARGTRDVLTRIESIDNACRAFIDSFDNINGGAERLHLATAAIGGAVDRQKELTAGIVDLTTHTTSNTQEVSARIKEVNEAAGTVLQLSIAANSSADAIAEALKDLLQGPVHQLEAFTAEGRAVATGQRPEPVVSS